MSAGRVHVSRTRVGLISLGLFAVALVVWIGWPEQQMALGACVRVGVLMAAIWLAMPSGDRPAAWATVSKTTVAGFLVLLVGVVRPRYLLALSPLLVLIGVLSYLGRLSEKERPARRERD
jgi:hypothetical protein